MAYMSQENKAKLAPAIKAVLKKYGVSGSLAVDNHSTLVLNIKSSKIDFIGNYNETCGSRSNGDRFTPATGSIQINPYWFHEHFSGKAKKFLTEVLATMNVGNWDRSDIQSDYFDVGFYVNVNIGKWNKPFEIK